MCKIQLVKPQEKLILICYRTAVKTSREESDVIYLCVCASACVVFQPPVYWLGRPWVQVGVSESALPPCHQNPLLPPAPDPASIQQQIEANGCCSMLMITYPSKIAA